MDIGKLVGKTLLSDLGMKIILRLLLVVRNKVNQLNVQFK